MTQLQGVENAGTAAIKRLRLKKLQKGLPFMINSKDLPGNQCYFEYPDGSIKLVTLLKSAKDFTEIKTLSSTEGNNVRLKYNLFH